MRLNSVIAGATVATLFSTGFLWRLPEFDLFLHYAAIPPLLLLGLLLSGGAVSRELLLLFAALLLHSLWSAALSGNAPGAALQQLLGFGATLAVFDYAFRINGFDCEKLFRIYLRAAVVVCGIGLVQALCFGLGIPPGYDFGWLIPGHAPALNQMGLLRVQSVMLEPAHFGIVISPAILVAVHDLTGRGARFLSRRQSAAVLLAAVLSLSAVTYIAMLAALLLVGLRRGALRGLLLGAVALGAALLAYAALPDIRMRADDMLALLLHQSVATANWSSLTLYNNAVVAWRSLLDTNLLGGGLGSHPASFARFSALFGESDIPLRYALLNSADAGALLLRIASELGLPGLIAAGAFLVRYHVPFVRQQVSGDGRQDWLISGAALVFFAVALLRQGHYFNYGLPFFGLLYLHAGRARRAATAGHGLPAAGERTA